MAGLASIPRLRKVAAFFSHSHGRHSKASYVIRHLTQLINYAAE